MATNTTVTKMIAEHNQRHHISKAKARNVPEIGTWGFITGVHIMSQDFFDKNYPRGIFGRVIDYQLRGTAVYLVIRTYRRYSKSRHPHSKTIVKYFKPL